MIESWKWLTIHGLGTIYRVSAFKFSAESLEILARSGFGTRPPFHDYIAILVWSPRTRIIIDNPHGDARDAISKAGFSDSNGECCVLEAGIQRILDDYDKIESGWNIEVNKEAMRSYGAPGATTIGRAHVW